MTLQTGRALRTKHAVLSLNDDEQYHLYDRSGDTPLESEALELRDLLFLCVSSGYTHLWIAPETINDLSPASYGDYGHRLQNYDLLPHWSQDGKALASMVGHRVNPRSHRFNIIFCEYSPWAFLPACQDDPARLLDITAEFERNLGVPMGGSPAGVGTRYLRAVTPEKYQYRLDAPRADLSQIPCLARPVIRQRAISSHEMQEGHVLIAIDKNAAYPRAAKDAMLGIGTPVRGLEGWEFPERARVLSKWVKYLWEKRMMYPSGHMRASYKQIMNDTIGLFRSQEVKGSWKYRPDWYAEIVNYSNMLIQENIAKFAREMQIWPAMVHIDALYYVLSRETAEKLLTAISGHSESLGGYKVKFQIPLDEEWEGETVRTILQSERTPAGQNGKLYCFNRIAERLGY